MSYETILYQKRDALATISLNRPDRLNTIAPKLPDEIEQAVGVANRDDDVKVIVLRGIGRSFCAGFDFGQDFGDGYGKDFSTGGSWDPGKELIGVTNPATGPVPKFMSLWHSSKPVIAQVHGWCVGGGSDLALCADLVIASEDAQIGTPYSRIWGCYLSGMWIYRLGLARCKWHALTGEPLSGREAADIELINRAVPFSELESSVEELAGRLASMPLSQLAAMKLVINKTYENQGIAGTQVLGSLLDGYMRNTPDALEFMREVAEHGVGPSIRKRDQKFGDYSEGGGDRQPNPAHIIRA